MIDPNHFEQKTVSYFTLGCKLNFTETSAIGRSLLEQGWRTARDSESPDLCIVNTCSVTELADKKCRQMIRKIHRDNPRARIVVTGCYAQLKPEDVAEIDGVDLVLGANEKGHLTEYLDRVYNHAINIDSCNGAMILHTPIEDVHAFAPSLSSEGRTRHFLKVQDGCDYNCSYCTIPMARGRSRNGSIDEIVKQAASIASEDSATEIVLTGVNVGDFGRSTKEKFIDLVKALDEVEGIARYRISSIEPNLTTDEIISFVAQSKRFAPHFHIPLQSGSDKVLRLMRRRYKSDVFRHKVEVIRELLPHAFIGVDVIVGTRGETDEYFEESYNFLKEMDVTKLHVFSYSERPGTDALKIDHVVDPRVKHRRSQRILALSEEKLHAFNLAQIGKEAEVLIEHSSEGPWISGFTANYARVRIPYDSSLAGQLVKVRIDSLAEDAPDVLNGSRI